MYVETTQATRNLKYRQLRDLRRYASQFKEPVFITITLNDLGIKKSPKSLFKALERLGINKYLLVSDIGSKNGRLHYHGLVEKSLLSLFHYVGIKKSKHNHNNAIYDLSNTSFEKNYGFVNAAISQDANIIESLGYMLKYTLKSNDSYFKHKIYKHNLLSIDNFNYKCLQNFKANFETLKRNRYIIESNNIKVNAMSLLAQTNLDYGYTYTSYYEMACRPWDFINLSTK